jgi:cell division protein FtsL
MSRPPLWLPLTLALAVTASGVGVVYAKYLSRKTFVQLQQLRAERDKVDSRWNRLQLEESALATYARVEAHARDRLRMHLPAPAEVVLLGQP